MEHHRGGHGGRGDHEGRGGGFGGHEGRGGGFGGRGGMGGEHEGRGGFGGEHEGRGGGMGRGGGPGHEGRGGMGGGRGGRRMHHSQQVMVMAIFSPKNGQEDAVEEIFANMAEKVFNNEPECLRYKIHKDEKSNDLIVVESYRDQQAVQKHMNSQDFQQLKNDLEGKLDKPMHVIQTTPSSGFPSRRAGLDADDD